MNPTPPAQPTSSTDQRPTRDAVSPDPSAVAARGRRSSSRSEGDITKAFSTSMVVSGIRCLLAYIVFPWILPLLGLAKGVGPAVGIGVGVIAIGFNIASIRRFMSTGHRYRYWIATINVVVIVMLSVLIIRDVVDLIN